MCGKDGNTLRGKIKNPELGFVGDVTSVDTAVLSQLVSSGHIPVVGDGGDGLGAGRRSTSTRTPPR